MKVSVIGKYWNIRVLSDKTYAKNHGSDSHGMAYVDDRKIFIRRSSLNKETIKHELVHAYFQELSFYELQLDDDQYEDFCCELLAKYGDHISKDADRVMAKYSH
jgi:hypothetical protein